jgi:hypothetical protein
MDPSQHSLESLEQAAATKRAQRVMQAAAEVTRQAQLAEKAKREAA